MSYCNLLGGCSASTVFHPRTVQILDPIVESKVGVCVFPVGTPKEASPAGAGPGCQYTQQLTGAGP